MEPQLVLTGTKEIDDALGYLHNIHANRVATACIRAGLRTGAANVRRHIRKSIRPRSRDKGIGWRLKKQTKKNKAEGKLGVAVGAAFSHGINYGKNRKVGKSKRRGVGITSRNLHWFALGTAKRYTQQSLPSAQRSRSWRSMFLADKAARGHYTGEIEATKWGGFVRNYGNQRVEASMVQVAIKALSVDLRKGTVGAEMALSQVLDRGVDFGD